MENRYSRQIAYLGKESQNKIGKSSVCVIGCGALGSSSAELLVRAGVGKIKLIDRDFIELSNLQRQHVFTEDDIDKPKALILADKLKKINSSVDIEYYISDFNAKNAETIIKKYDLILDGLDNMHSRFLLNEACAKLGISCVYGSAIRNIGYVSLVDPKKCCLNCFIEKLPINTENCETSGVMNSITSLISSVQVNETLNFLGKKKSKLRSKLFHADLENMRINVFEIRKNPDCRVCSLKKFDFLTGKNKPYETISLCGKDSYHLSPPSGIKLDLQAAKKRLAKEFSVISENKFLIRARSKNKELTIFSDGRMITRNIEKIDAEKAFAKLILI